MVGGDGVGECWTKGMKIPLQKSCIRVYNRKIFLACGALFEFPLLILFEETPKFSMQIVN